MNSGRLDLNQRPLDPQSFLRVSVPPLRHYQRGFQRRKCGCRNVLLWRHTSARLVCWWRSGLSSTGVPLAPAPVATKLRIVCSADADGDVKAFLQPCVTSDTHRSHCLSPTLRLSVPSASAQPLVLLCDAGYRRHRDSKPGVGRAPSPARSRALATPSEDIEQMEPIKFTPRHVCGGILHQEAIKQRRIRLRARRRKRSE